MLCQQCKAKQAKVSLYGNFNGNTTQLSLCSSCAAFKTQYIPSNNQINKAGTNNKSTLKCNNCGATINEFYTAGFCGCSECYKVFNEQMIFSINQIQGASTHCGKSIYLNVQPSLSQLTLQQQLELAVKEERYSDANKLKQQINRGLNNDR